ncbi:MAG: DUF998 domain-containing protein [Cryobacterium sp.]|nr:DUF998 domain-containing protein [Cryobacterium sp.]
MRAMTLDGVIHPRSSTGGLRLAGTAGILMYPIFALTVVLLTWLEWDFLHGTGWTVMHENTVNYPSALARGDLGLLQSLNFLLLGVLAVIFGQGLRTQFAHRRSGAVATAAIAAVGLSGVFSAFFTDLPKEPASWHGLLHGIGFLLLMLGSAVTFVASGLALRGSPGWKGYWVYSLVNAPLAIGVASALSSLGQVSFYGLVTVLLTWFAVMGIRLRQVADRHHPGDDVAKVRSDPD